MKLKPISIAILLSSLPTSLVFAAGLDRSGQSIQAFLQPGNYAEAGISVLDPTVKGTSKVSAFEGEKINDMGEDYYFPSAAIKVQATDKISLGLIYDQPFGADATYAETAGSFGNGVEGTSVDVDTHNLTALIGYQPTENWNFYAGPVWQTVEADIKLRGGAYSLLSGYNIQLKQEEAFGWLAGFAYQIPEIALKASVTYRSEIKHKATGTESFTFAQSTTLAPGFTVPAGTTVPMSNERVDAITPQSVNLDFQSGVAQNTIAFANIRWVHWDQFAVTPVFLKANSGNNLIDYSDDQWSANIGVGHKFNDKWSASTSVGWDSGAGNPVTTLGPTEGYWSLGLGAQYSPAANYFIQAGVKHLWLGDATAQTGGNPVGEFEDNNAWAYGMKIGYRF
ncbi:transporter [Acinetobacter sp. ACNIH3]|uniref:OmpP1/FadL family transporter n=1 Tax=unclassified Acinetobacter TaxID=196816 RepID=UPI000CDE173D|nr:MULTISPECIES: outer membrane protein transport protein [unclassified Acinetobacter]POU22145.1 transporter [Acinetobacter sp. ACNIH3]POV77823.1 transporter [Acinetobacter sp. ACNIH4]